MPKVLLVEDDNNLREIFDMRLQAEGYKTVTAGDGEEALVIAVKEKPDLVIADVMMPKLSGFEMVENMRAAPELANVKVIMMTALGQAEDRARGEKLGVVKYLVKSQVTLEDFVRVVREVMPPDESGAGAAVPAQPDNAAQQDNINKPGSELSRGSASISEADSRESLLPGKQESETSMQDEGQTPTNPMPGAGSTPAPDAGAPAADPATNPISDSPAPLGGAPSSDPQTTAEETSAVQDQIDNFESDPAAGAAPASDVSMPMPAADPAAPAPDAGVPTPTSDPAAMPSNEPAAPDTGAVPLDPNSPAAGQAPATPEATTAPEQNNAL
jgi:DNA-binding response OmpR family regulator